MTARFSLGPEPFCDDYKGFEISMTPRDTPQLRKRCVDTIQVVASIVAMQKEAYRRVTTQRKGILDALGLRFFPDTTKLTLTGQHFVNTTSSAAIGSAVDKQMDALVRTKKLPKRSQRYARWIAEFLRRSHFYPLASQLPIQVGGLWTFVDLVCLNCVTGRLVVFEIKTGYDHFYDRACEEQPVLPFLGVPNTWRNHHLLQLSVMALQLTRAPFNIPRRLIEGYVLRVNNTDGVCRLAALPRWYDHDVVVGVMEMSTDKVNRRRKKWLRENEAIPEKRRM